jgi:hypothetical protein
LAATEKIATRTASDGTRFIGNGWYRTLRMKDRQIDWIARGRRICTQRRVAVAVLSLFGHARSQGHG